MRKMGTKTSTKSRCLVKTTQRGFVLFIITLFNYRV